MPREGNNFEIGGPEMSKPTLTINEVKHRDPTPEQSAPRSEDQAPEEPKPNS